MTVSLPTSIDSTGGRDVTAELTDFLQSVPDNTEVQFPKKRVYRCDTTIELNQKVGLGIRGNGCQLTTRPTDDGQRAQLRISNGQGSFIRNLVIEGGSTTPGIFDWDHQWQHGLDVRGEEQLTLTNVQVRNVRGDGFYFGIGDGVVGYRQTASVRAERCSVRGNGRQGVSCTHAHEISWRNGLLDNIALMAFNVEPNPGQSVLGATFSDNRISRVPRQQVLGIVGHGPVSDVTLAGNFLLGKALTVLADSADSYRFKNLAVINNVSDTPITSGYVVEATGVDGITVLGNAQQISGPFTKLTNCTGINVQQQSA